jgi:hypothetical protein
MSERKREWAKLAVQSEKARAPVRIRDLAGVAQLEDKLLLYSDHHGAPSHECRDAAETLCRDIFGVSSPDAEFPYPETFWDLHKNDPARWEIEDQREEHEDQFETLALAAEDQVAVLMKLGLDFTAADGRPLRCVVLFARAAEAAAKKLPGFDSRMPSPEEADAISFETNLAAEAAAFQKGKRKR